MNDLMSDCHKIGQSDSDDLMKLTASQFHEVVTCDNDAVHFSGKALDVSEQNICSLIVKTSENIFLV